MKKGLHTALIAICLVFSLTISVSAIDLNITRYRQVKSSWCWAACAQMVGNYLGYSHNQYDISEYVKGNSTNNESASFDEVEDAINFATDFDYSYYTFGVLERSILEDCLYNDTPPVIRMQYTSSGHALVVCGVNGGAVTLIDPLGNTSTNTYSYAGLVNGLTTGSGTGHYSNTWKSD